MKKPAPSGSPARVEPLPWELPGAHWMGNEELEAVARVIRGRSPFRYYGPRLEGMADRLEERFRERLGRRHALALASGSSALYVSLAAMGVGAGDEVLLPGYLWVRCRSGRRQRAVPDHAARHAGGLPPPACRPRAGGVARPSRQYGVRSPVAMGLALVLQQHEPGAPAQQ